jgi:hypothetical protein
MSEGSGKAVPIGLRVEAEVFSSVCTPKRQEQLLIAFYPLTSGVQIMMKLQRYKLS